MCRFMNKESEACEDVSNGSRRPRRAVGPGSSNDAHKLMDRSQGMQEGNKEILSKPIRKVLLFYPIKKMIFVCTLR